jgi:predicted nucleotidyltransferase
MVSQTNKQLLTTETVLQTLRAQPNLFAQFKIKTLALFGSTARNQATAASDLDFLVEFDADPTLDLYMDLKFFLEDLFEKKVDLVTKGSLKSQIADRVLAEVIHR